MADLKTGTFCQSVQLTSGLLYPPQNSTNQASNLDDTNFVSGGGSSDDVQYFGGTYVLYQY